MLNDDISNSYIPYISLCFPSFLMTDYARKMSLDLRMIDENAYSDHIDNKASHCAKMLNDYYRKFDAQKGTQFVFSDLGTYKPGAVLSGNTDLLEKARLDKKITTLESERKNFLRERDAANGKLAEIDSSVSFHTDKIKEAQSDLALFEQRVERDEGGTPINKLTIKGMEDSTDIKAIAARLQEIDEKARTKGEYNKIGEVYGFSIMVKTESTSKDLFDCSVNRFFVKGQESIYYTYNNGKLATDPKLACQNFVNALERIPKVIESHEKEMAKIVANKDVYTNIANSSWKKEDEFRSLKGQAAELDRKIALSLAPPDEDKEEKEGIKQGKDLPDNNYSAKIKNENKPVQNKEEDSRLQSFRPKWIR